tara:strand:+ start:619 stop:1053 length:435 start_codon:yes stop_codon:yes gene_type:complete
MIKQIGNKSFLNWDDVEVLVKKLCDKITRSNLDIKDIWGLPRGGLIPAVMVSHKLGIPMTKGTITPDTLIIDDICDSGVTLANFYKTYQDEFAFPFDLKTAVLHYKPQTSVFEPTLFANQWSSNNWIIYPWERDDSNSIQDYKL